MTSKRAGVRSVLNDPKIKREKKRTLSIFDKASNEVVQTEGIDSCVRINHEQVLREYERDKGQLNSSAENKDLHGDSLRRRKG